MKKLRVFEAFAGVGSQRMALRNLGINHEVVGISEIDKYSLRSYEAIHGDCPNFGDISKINPNDLPNMDLFTYSFPCQDLSVSGKQMGLGKGTRSGLLYECEKIIETKKPKYLLLENVKNLVSKKFKEDFDKWLYYLEKLGYQNYWQVLNAKDYGIPQNRERVFVISILNNYKCYKFPPKTNLSNKLSDVLEDMVDEKYYINTEKANKLIEEFITTGKKSLNINPSNKGMGGIVRNDSIANTITCGHGEGQKIVHPCITPGRINKRQNGKRFRDNEDPMYTLTSQDTHGVLIGDYRYDEGLRIRKNGMCPCLTLKVGSSSLSSNPLVICDDEI